MAVEVTVGILASSLALLSDAAHMLTDATAIGLSLVAIRLAQRPAKGPLTFGPATGSAPPSTSPRAFPG
ncbi:MAG TPA: cation transporter [Solirubrobacteraceae bacterium]